MRMSDKVPVAANRARVKSWGRLICERPRRNEVRASHPRANSVSQIIWNAYVIGHDRRTRQRPCDWEVARNAR
jgi:hypothetical protein